MNNKEIFKKNKIIAIAVDCGYENTKICINDKLFTFPSYIFPLMPNEEVFTDYNDIIYNECFVNRGAASYIVGKAAKLLISESIRKGKNQEFISKIKSLNVFGGVEEGVYLIRAAISYALVKYSEKNDIGFSLDDLSLFAIYTNLVLPCNIMHQYRWYLRSILSENVDINLGINRKMYSINLDIKSEHIVVSSQILDVLKDLIYDINGKYAYDIEELLEMLPAVIIDGGYYRTQGLATIKKGASLVVQKISSYEEYSMIEVDKETARIINDKAMENDVVNYEPINEYDIDRYIRYKIDFVYDVKDNSIERGKRRMKVEFNEIQDIKEQVLEKTAKKYCEFLINTYEIGNAITIFIAGGTGVAYYEMIKKYVSEFDDTVNIILLEDTYDNKLFGTIYAVVMGAYKGLIRKIRKEVL